MGWQDFGDVRKGRGGKATGKDRFKGNKLSAKDAKKIVENDPKYKSADNPKAQKNARARRKYS